MPPEIGPLLDDIKSLIGKIEMLDTGGGTEPSIEETPPVEPTEEEVQMAMDEETAEELPIEEGEKVAKSDKGITADDDAETRLEGAPPSVTEENLAKVAKSLQRRVTNATNNTVVSQRIQQLTTAVHSLTQVAKSLIQHQEDTSRALTHILDGLGVTKQVTERVKVEKSQTQPRFQNVALQNQVYKAMADLFANKPQEQDAPEIQVNNVYDNTRNVNNVRKGLAELMPALVSTYQKNNGTNVTKSIGGRF